MNHDIEIKKTKLFASVDGFCGKHQRKWRAKYQKDNIVAAHIIKNKLKKIPTKNIIGYNIYDRDAIPMPDEESYEYKQAMESFEGVCPYCGKKYKVYEVDK